MTGVRGPSAEEHPLRPAQALARLRDLGVGRGDAIAVCGRARWPALALATQGGDLVVAPFDAAETTAMIEDALRPRWVVWSRRDSRALLDLGAPLANCWDVDAVHRLTVGGGRAAPGVVWAHHRGLDPTAVPSPATATSVPDLFTEAERAEGDPDDPVRADGHLRADWGGDEWAPTTGQLGRWTSLALDVACDQMDERAGVGPTPTLVARSESAAGLLCNEMELGGLPIGRAALLALLHDLIGPRPGDDAHAAVIRRRRDDSVLRHVPGPDDIDLRSPTQVKTLLRRCGIEVEDTRAWRLRTLVGTHPVVEPLLRWRKAERIATTYGYAWMDAHVGSDDRLRGEWAASDGASGRMTASAGLHSLTAELRPGVVAEPGHVFVRSDLGQIEPRVMAAVSRDPRLAAASGADDLYADVASTLGVEREIAKVAVLGAMYGQTTGRGAQALGELRRAYPVSMAFLDHADAEARAGRDVQTFGGRLLRMDASGDHLLAEGPARSRSAARGRYGRNAVIQGAAAELFKMWAVTVRARIRGLGAEIVLCLHDELLVHTPASSGTEVAAVVDAALQEAVARWAPDGRVRFLAQTSIVARWSDVKP